MAHDIVEERLDSHGFGNTSPARAGTNTAARRAPPTAVPLRDHHGRHPGGPLPRRRALTSPSLPSSPAIATFSSRPGEKAAMLDPDVMRPVFADPKTNFVFKKLFGAGAQAPAHRAAQRAARAAARARGGGGDLPARGGAASAWRS